MQIKFTIALLFIGLLSATTVGGVAYWMVDNDFKQLIMDTAFDHFQKDVKQYIITYGNWEAAISQENFTDFVKRQRSIPQTELFEQNSPLDIQINRGNNPPFRFLLLTPSGTVLKGLTDYPLGSKVSNELFQRARAIEINGKIVAFAAPIGRPNYTDRDKSYLEAMRKALFIGGAVAVLLALVIGIISGRRLTRILVELTKAIKAMQQDNKVEHIVEINSHDELGELAKAFNSMNRELVLSHKKLLELSIKDPLTTLYNRRHFDQQANTLFEQATRYQQPLSVMVGDLDHFKLINDNFSHEMGDIVLRQVAKMLIAGTRKSDVVARYGGEEFVILFANTPLIKAYECCEKLRSNIESYAWQQLDSKLRVTMSMGLCDDLTLKSVEKMVAQADTGLYQAKHNGRNQVICIEKSANL